MEKAIIIGGAGFTGSALTSQLRKSGTIVYNVIRPASPHIKRIDMKDDGLHLIECELSELSSVSQMVSCSPETMFYLSWTDETTYFGQFKNIFFINDAIKLASELKCKRIVITGSQAEYGIVSHNELIYENREPNPYTDYGTAKVAACYLSKQYASDLGIEWVWGRIFSLIGKNEPKTRMLPALYDALKKGESFLLSSCRQNWDYLDVHDAADALIALAEKGKPGEIYNIANGEYRELKEYVNELRKIVGGTTNVTFGDDPSPFVSLQPSVEKIFKDTGWKAKRCFADSIKDYN